MNEIFKAELSEDKKINISINSNFTPMLCYALYLLRLEIDKRILEQNLQQEIKDAESNIVVPDNGKVKAFLRPIKGSK